MITWAVMTNLLEGQTSAALPDELLHYLLKAGHELSPAELGRVLGPPVASGAREHALLPQYKLDTSARNADIVLLGE